MKIKNSIVFFLFGSVGYGTIELLWRGYTHWTMLIAGGLCFMIISAISEGFKCNILSKAIICALVITAVEFAFGMIFNVLLDMKIWDYSQLPCNLFGQVCPMFTALWACLAVFLLPLADTLNKFLELYEK